MYLSVKPVELTRDVIAQCVRLAEKLLPDKISDERARGDIGFVPLMRQVVQGDKGDRVYSGRDVDANMYRLPKEFDPLEDENSEDKAERSIKKLPHRPQYESFSTRMKGLVAGMLRDMGLKSSLLSRKRGQARNESSRVCPRFWTTWWR